MPAKTAPPESARAGVAFDPRFTFQPGADNPAYRDARLRRANLHLENEEYEEAERLLSRHLKERPNDPEALASLAVLLAAGRGRLQSAEKAARRAIALAPRGVAGYFALGYVYLLGSRLEPGFRYLMKAREIDPRDPRVNFGLRRFDELRPPVISDLAAGNRLNRALGSLRGAVFRQRRAALLFAALLAVLIGIGACATFAG
jgi:Flp pilus assembly protein TadD